MRGTPCSFDLPAPAHRIWHSDSRGAAAGDDSDRAAVHAECRHRAQVTKQRVAVYDVVYDPVRMEFLRFSRNAIARITQTGMIIITVKNEMLSEMKIPTFGLSTP